MCFREKISTNLHLRSAYFTSVAMFNNSPIQVVTVRFRTGLRVQESWIWTWTWLYSKTHEKVFWILTQTLNLTLK